MAQEISERKGAQPRLVTPTVNGAANAPGRAAAKPSSLLWLWLTLVLVLLVVAAGYLISRHLSSMTAAKKKGRGSDKIRVVTATATRGNIGVYLTGLGAVTPLYSDTIQSRVSGQLMKVLFTEGQMVKAGDLLEQIDSRPYEAQLAQYVAQKEHDEALLDNAKIDEQRYETLWKQDSIPQQQLATQQALVKQDQGTVDSDQALIDATKLNITYCNITAPISGRAGLRLVDPGNYVQSTSTTGLLVINQIQPITVVFTIAEDNIQPVLDKLRTGQKLAVDAYTRDDQEKLATGELLTVDNQIDPSTGTLKLKASFPNTDNALFPNQFVNVKLLVDTKKNVVLVPVVAIQTGNQGTFVYVVDTDNNTVSMKNVAEGTISLDGSVVEITSGISAGDVVVVNGVDKLQDGSKVIITKPSAPAGHSTNAPAATPPASIGAGA